MCLWISPITFRRLHPERVYGHWSSCHAPQSSDFELSDLLSKTKTSFVYLEIQNFLLSVSTKVTWGFYDVPKEYFFRNFSTKIVSNAHCKWNINTILYIKRFLFVKQCFISENIQGNLSSCLALYACFDQIL